MRVTIDTDYVLDSVDGQLEKYGIGIPVGLVVMGAVLVFAASPGLSDLSSLTWYGHIGVAIVASSGALSFVLAGVAYYQIDTGWWKLVFDRDGPGGSG